MTQKFDEYIFPCEQTTAANIPGHDYIQEQYGGGRRYESPPAELTPTRLRSRIKATQRDSGIVREAAIRRQGNLLPPDTDDHASASLETAPSNASVTGGGESSSSLPSGGHGGHHKSPYLRGSSLSPHPAALQDMFYNPTDVQPAWLTQDSSAFGMMEDNSFTAMLLDTQDHFLTTPGYSNQQNIVEGSSSQRTNQEAVLTSLTTNVIPPSPLKDTGSNSSVAHTDPLRSHDHVPGAFDTIGGDQDCQDAPASTSGELFVTGRKSADAQAILEAGFIDIERSFLQLSESTSIPPQQIINSFLKSRGRTTINTNFWNIYARSYFKENVEEELARVGAMLPADGGSPNMSIRTKCYERFKETFPDTYKDILTVYDEMRTLSGSPHTVSQRAQEFQKYYKRLFSTIDGAATKFGFETAVVTCGKIVNQDTSLGQVHMSPGAANFFNVRCRANDDTIIGHLKAHVYNGTSLAAVEEAFADEFPEHEKEEEASSKDALTESTEGRDEGLRWFKKEFSQKVAKQGGRIPSGDFPWKRMTGILADGGLFIEGYPAHKCPMPGEYNSVSAKSKGIGGLTREGITALVDALKAGVMRVVKSPSKPRASLIASEHPVIIGEAPPSTWDHSCARRMFANGKTDYNGPPCLMSSSALTRVKKVENLSNHHTTAKGVLSPPQAPAHSAKVVLQPPVQSTIVGPPSPPLFCPSKVIYKPKLAPKPSQKEVIEISSTSDSQDIILEHSDTEYEDDSPAKKRKRKAIGKSSRASKKRTPIDEGIESKKMKDKKGKKPLTTSDTSLSKGGPDSPLTVKSSGDEERPVNEGQAEMLPAMRPRDGPPEWEAHIKVVPKPKRVIKGSRGCAHRMVYSDSEKEDMPSTKDEQAKVAPSGALQTRPDTPAPVTATVVAMEATVDEVPRQDDVLMLLEVPPTEPLALKKTSQTASGEEHLEPLPHSPMSSLCPSTEARQAEHQDHEHYPSTHACEPREPPTVHPREPPIHPREPPIHPREPTAHQHEPSVEPPLHSRKPLIHPHEPPVHLREPPIHPHEPPFHPREPPIHPREPPIHPREPPIHPREPPIHPHEPPIHLREPPIHPREPPIHPREPPIHSREPLVHPREPPIHPREPPINPRFHSREPLIQSREPSTHLCERSVYSHEPSIHEPSIRSNEPSIYSREPSIYSREPSVYSREPSIHPCEGANTPMHQRNAIQYRHEVTPHHEQDSLHPHDVLYNRTRNHPHPTGGFVDHRGPARARTLEEARYQDGHAPMAYNHSGYSDRHNDYDNRYNDRRYPSDDYHQGARSHDRRDYGYYGDRQGDN